MVSELIDKELVLKGPCCSRRAVRCRQSKIVQTLCSNTCYDFDYAGEFMIGKSKPKQVHVFVQPFHVIAGDLHENLQYEIPFPLKHPTFKTSFNCLLVSEEATGYLDFGDTRGTVFSLLFQPRNG